MDLTKQIQISFEDSINSKELAAKSLVPKIELAGRIFVNSLRNGGKVLTCGNGGSACDAQHFTTELVSRFLMERDGLPSISLTADMAVVTAIGNDYGYQDLFARQVNALGRKGDVLLAISTSGNSPNVVAAIHNAHELEMNVVALTGKDGGTMATVLRESDIEIRVPSKTTPRIQEVHILIIHCLCGFIETSIFRKDEEIK